MDKFREEQYQIVKTTMENQATMQADIFTYIIGMVNSLSDRTGAQEEAKGLVATLSAMMDASIDDPDLLKKSPGGFLADAMRRLYIDPDCACVYGNGGNAADDTYVRGFVASLCDSFSGGDHDSTSR